MSWYMVSNLEISQVRLLSQLYSLLSHADYPSVRLIDRFKQQRAKIVEGQIGDYFRQVHPLVPLIPRIQPFQPSRDASTVFRADSPYQGAKIGGVSRWLLIDQDGLVHLVDPEREIVSETYQQVDSSYRSTLLLGWQQESGFGMTDCFFWRGRSLIDRPLQGRFQRDWLKQLIRELNGQPGLHYWLADYFSARECHDQQELSGIYHSGITGESNTRTLLFITSVSS